MEEEREEYILTEREAESHLSKRRRTPFKMAYNARLLSNMCIYLCYN